MGEKIGIMWTNRYVKILLSTIAVVWTLGVQTSNFISVLLVLLFYFLYKQETAFADKRESIIGNGLAVVLALFQVLGNYDDFNTHIDLQIILLAKYVIAFAGWCVIFATISKMIFAITREKNLVFDDQNRTKGKKVFGISFGVMFLCWVPYFLIYYPGILTWDTEWQFEQALGLRGYSNHQPVLHTLFLKFWYQIGEGLFHNPNAGMAVCVVVQMILMALIFSFLIYVLYKHHVRKGYLMMCLAFFALVPFNALYSITIWKDILFSGIVLLFTILMWQIQQMEEVRGKRYWLKMAVFSMISILVCLMRSNGFYAYLVCIPFMIVLLKKHRKEIVISCILVLGIVCTIKGPVMEAKGVIQPDTAENLSIPLQHIARVITDGGELTSDERELLSQVIDIDRIPEEYLDYISDPIKTLIREKGNQDYILEHKQEFFMLWLKLGIRYPGEYLKAQIDQTKGYWSTDEQYWVTTTEVTEHADVLNMYRDSKLPWIFTKIAGWAENAYVEIPLLGMLWSIGFYLWLVLLSVAVALKKKKSILPYLPVLALWASLLIATPVYAEFRYIYAMIITVPFFIAISMGDERKKLQECEM